LRKNVKTGGEILPFLYDRPGAMKAFLDLAELGKAALIRELGEAAAFRGPDGRWRVSESAAAGLWAGIQAEYAVAWSA